MTGKCSKLRGNRPKAMWGSIVGGLINLGASYLSSRSQAKAMKQQLDAQKELAKEQMLATNQNSLANTLNNYAAAQQSYDNQDYNLKYRNGGRKSILRNSNIVITDGGDAQPIDNNTFLLRGGTHEDINETGQTGIGINVGGNQIEAEGGEVAQKKDGALRIFSAQPILGNGLSPAQAVLRGYNKDKVFAAQQRFKRNNHFKDDGSKLRNGGKISKDNYYNWMSAVSSNLGISPIDGTYDYRAYYNSVTPYERSLMRYAPQGTHFTDVGKRPNHPTFSNESKYSNSKTPGGNWNGDVFVPSIWQFGNDGNGYRNWYMKDTGEGYFDGKRNVYPRSKKADGGWTKPVYPTVGYNGSKRVRQYIAKAEGSDFAKQNRQFKGDAIGAKERELRNFMGKAYAHLNEGQRDALLSYYYNLTPSTFVKQYKGLRDRLINAQTEQEYNDTINAMKNSINVGWNNKKLPGLRNRRAVERSWFGYTNPAAQQLVNDKVKQIETALNDNTTVVTQPQIIEVPVAPKVPAGVVPIDKDNNYLLNGNIKQNLINMGNRFKVKYSCGGTARKRNRLGSASRPVKGMYGVARPKAVNGTEVVITAPNKRTFNDWNNYMFNYGLGFSNTPNIAYQNTSINNNSVVRNNNLGTYNDSNSRLLFGTGDYVSLGADLISALGGSIINGSAYNGLNFDYELPGYVDESPIALNTTYHNEAQVANVERNRLNARNSILRNSMSSSSALNRMQTSDTNAMYQQNQLFDEKANKETELRNQNLMNEQQVRARNAAAKNQWLQNVASIKNSAIAARNQAQLAKANSLSVGLSGVGQAVNNFISQGRQNYDDEQAMLMGIAASDYATPSRLLDLGVNLSPSSLAGIYRSVNNTPDPGAKPQPDDYSSTTEYSMALNKWERDNKAYNQRNSYANLIKSRMSARNRLRYGIN